MGVCLPTSTSAPRLPTPSNTHKHRHINSRPSSTNSKGYNDGADCAHELIPRVAEWGAAAVTLHGRTRQQRYSRAADWAYIDRCADAAAAAGLPLVGNGDVLSYDDWRGHMERGRVTTCMVGRGALIKPVKGGGQLRLLYFAAECSAN